MRSESLVSRAFHQVFRAGFLLVGITDVDPSAESEPRSSCLGQADKTTLETTATTTNRVANGGREPRERGGLWGKARLGSHLYGNKR